MMKSRVIAVVCAIIAMAGTGCTDTVSPVSSVPTGNPNDGGIGSQYQVDEVLNSMDPELLAWVRDDGAYELSMVVGAGGMADSPEMEAMRGINLVEFQILSPQNLRIDFRQTDVLESSGVARDDGFMSLTTTANVSMSPAAVLQPGSSASMTIHTDDGVVVRSTLLPTY